MAEFTLHCFAESGNAYKTALMLQLCGADWEARRVAFFGGETRSPEYRAVNVMGEAPVMVHHRPNLGQEAGDFTLSQSGAILTYLSRHFGKFGHATEAEDYEIMRWVLFDNHKFTSYTATARFMIHFQKKAGDPTAEFIRARAKGAWTVLEQHLATRDFVVGGRPTIADLSLCGYLYWPEQIGMNADDYPAISAWLGRIRNLPGWASPERLMPSGQ